MKYISPEPHLRFMQNVEDFIDNLIRDHGDVLFYVWTILSFVAIAWVLSGGLRRRMNRKGTRYVLVALPIAVRRQRPTPQRYPPLFSISRPGRRARIPPHRMIPSLWPSQCRYPTQG